MDVVEPCVTLWKREEVWRRGGSAPTLSGGMRIPFSCFFGIVFWFVFGKRLFPVVVEFLSVLGGPGIIIFVPFFDILQFWHEKVGPSFLHTITVFWLDFQALGPPKIVRKRKKGSLEIIGSLGCPKIRVKSVFS